MTFRLVLSGSLGDAIHGAFVVPDHGDVPMIVNFSFSFVDHISQNGVCGFVVVCLLLQFRAFLCESIDLCKLSFYSFLLESFFLLLV